MILLLDNYDSFTYNVYQMVGELQPDIQVYRNDAISLAQIRTLQPSHIILSPGPGYPAAAGIMPDIIRAFHTSIPILGICLGHQAVAESFGAKIVEAPVPVHGKISNIHIEKGCPLFKDIPEIIPVGRYHSLMADPAAWPACLAVTATSEDGIIMALQHRQYPVFGLQFHPESILTQDGVSLFKAFLAQS